MTCVLLDDLDLFSGDRRRARLLRRLRLTILGRLYESLGRDLRGMKS